MRGISPSFAESDFRRVRHCSRQPVTLRRTLRDGGAAADAIDDIFPPSTSVALERRLDLSARIAYRVIAAVTVCLGYSRISAVSAVDLPVSGPATRRKRSWSIAYSNDLKRPPRVRTIRYGCPARKRTRIERRLHGGDHERRDIAADLVRAKQGIDRRMRRHAAFDDSGIRRQLDVGGPRRGLLSGSDAAREQRGRCRHEHECRPTEWPIERISSSQYASH